MPLNNQSEGETGVGVVAALAAGVPVAWLGPTHIRAKKHPCPVALDGYIFLTLMTTGIFTALNLKSFSTISMSRNTGPYYNE
ncbi:hypothetical protein SAMN02745723_10330 [Pragia fontium DSM 5563 = ATCC 49100]|uniref:Uncharacterized protein n=1 Tax=Pragia fontium DSM 5563 = ATCC 49100 TaxID=1122977 RepID=A0AAJ4W9K8_9GAMM|nr:hypothetical protein SAMN02745723_10330 [Pragia fontium DSM 5563 = ATCC 49100]VEJ56684.1 Uncharacterised protein [Pragia fontium]